MEVLWWRLSLPPCRLGHHHHCRPARSRTAAPARTSSPMTAQTGMRPGYRTQVWVGAAPSTHSTVCSTLPSPPCAGLCIMLPLHASSDNMCVAPHLPPARCPLAGRPSSSSYQPPQPHYPDPQHMHAPAAPAGAFSVTVSNLPLDASPQEVAGAFRRALNLQVRQLAAAIGAGRRSTHLEAQPHNTPRLAAHPEQAPHISAQQQAPASAPVSSPPSALSPPTVPDITR